MGSDGFSSTAFAKLSRMVYALAMRRFVSKVSPTALSRIPCLHPKHC